MKGITYLLALDGSNESRLAAYLAWSLAEKTQAKVVAQHVVNTCGAQRLLTCKSPGFIGSALYVEAYQSTILGLRAIAEGLMVSYNAQVEGRNIQSETFIDEGDPIEEICKRAANSQLLIIGHDKSTQGQFRDNHYNLCERLSESSPCPVLIVHAACDDCKNMLICVEKAHPETIDHLTQFAPVLGLPKELCLTSMVTEVPYASSHYSDPALLLWRQTA